MAKRTALRNIVARTTESIPLVIWRRLTPRSRITVNYHLVSDHDVPHMGRLLPHKTPRQFARDVEYLCRYHRILANEESDDHPATSRTPVSITFDDGLVEACTVIRPILNRHGVRAFFFLIPDCIDNRKMMYRHKASLCIERVVTAPAAERAELLSLCGHTSDQRLDDAVALQRWLLDFSTPVTLIDEVCDRLQVDVSRYLTERTPYLSTDQVRQLAEDGHVIGSHSVSHSPLWRMKPEEIEREIIDSCEAIARLTGRERVPFAAPYSLEGVDRSLLLSIARTHPQVGQIFGTSGVLAEPDGILSRVGGDDPRGAGEDQTNLPLLLRRAYAFNARQNVARPLRRLFP
jgi:peptidoglycan/xylan/chitin deacetylase (PgdA/CDA1 family)